MVTHIKAFGEDGSYTGMREYPFLNISETSSSSCHQPCLPRLWKERTTIFSALSEYMSSTGVMTSTTCLPENSSTLPRSATSSCPSMSSTPRLTNVLSSALRYVVGSSCAPSNRSKSCC